MFPEKVEFVITVVPRLRTAPPPAVAVFCVNVEPDMLSIVPAEFVTAPPKKPVFSLKVQSSML